MCSALAEISTNAAELNERPYQRRLFYSKPLISFTLILSCPHLLTHQQVYASVLQLGLFPKTGGTGRDKMCHHVSRVHLRQAARLDLDLSFVHFKDSQWL